MVAGARQGKDGVKLNRTEDSGAVGRSLKRTVHVCTSNIHNIHIQYIHTFAGWLIYQLFMHLNFSDNIAF